MPDDKTKPDPAAEPWERFAKAATEWIHFAAALSPYSLDYRQRIGELFRALESNVTNWR